METFELTHEPMAVLQPSAQQGQLAELSALQLELVGGGAADVVFV